jgi:hypothetical protein
MRCTAGCFGVAAGSFMGLMLTARDKTNGSTLSDAAVSWLHDVLLFVLRHHHHQITKLSHSINAIGPAPHRFVLRVVWLRLQCTVLAMYTPAMHSCFIYAPAAHSALQAAGVNVRVC